MLFIFLNLSPPWAARAARASSIGVLFAVIVTAAEGALAVVVPAVVEAAGLTAAGSWAIAALVINERVRTRKYFFISNPPQIKEYNPLDQKLSRRFSEMRRLPAFGLPRPPPPKPPKPPARPRDWPNKGDERLPSGGARFTLLKRFAK